MSENAPPNQTPAPTSENLTTENDSNAGSNNGNNSRGNRGGENRRNPYNANERTWEGDKGEIGAVLGLRTEYLDKKTSFRVLSRS